MQNIRAKIKRKFSMNDKNANLDDEFDPEDIDEETTGHLHREITKAEAENEPHGKPGSFLNKLIMHGNAKTEKEMSGEGSHLAKENEKP
ncbi:uncharacterized protein RCC_06140 [Ramularia collo-cygni]|uniref:Uncharacterized protein n=1 Tax=Ramularia collo-cygni TaxID=112498 RepID=A0A2D3USH0_9PEZI|nr:uncharacterized protein RCC_06140 [Ramularia collo-cygni]CZT20282.1 uncharacterized protein RCC_06140 [Ramularia collo-cygni]